MTKRISFIIVLAVSALLLHGCGGNSQYGNSTTNEVTIQSASAQDSGSVSSNAKEIPVTISNFAFDPQTVTINKGDTIIWTNQDSMAHTATGKGFDSGNLDKGAVFKFTFNDTGSFNYVCSYHANMKGQIIVK